MGFPNDETEFEYEKPTEPPRGIEVEPVFIEGAQGASGGVDVIPVDVQFAPGVTLARFHW